MNELSRKDWIKLGLKIGIAGIQIGIVFIGVEIVLYIFHWYMYPRPRSEQLMIYATLLNIIVVVMVVLSQILHLIINVVKSKYSEYFLFQMVWLSAVFLILIWVEMQLLMYNHRWDLFVTPVFLFILTAAITSNALDNVREALIQALFGKTGQEKSAGKETTI